MSIRYSTRRTLPKPEPLGALLRRMREEKALPLRVPAAAAAIDSALLSKIELGQRLPTPTQLAALAKFFGLGGAALEARRLAEELRRSYGDHPGLAEAAAIIHEEAGEYPVKKMSAAVSKPAKSVNKRKKTK